jgi:hypothetical protein
MKHTQWLLILLVIVLRTLPAHSDALDSLEQAFIDHPQIQEKVYIQTDNNCYFIGDTLWYKAFVMRSDNLRPTNMSKMLYVELLSPDGLVAERQRIIVSDRGYTCGQFVLRDSLYSGYYELRAYTRWMLNFNCFERPSTRDDRLRFYNQQMAQDFYRDWDGLYSRVIPVYSKPAKAGNYDDRYMYGRPKQRLMADAKEQLRCTFFPEGGTLVRGLTQRVAFELTNQNGEAVDTVGQIAGRRVSTLRMGRGLFSVTVPEDSVRQRLHVAWHGHSYDFPLPKAAENGVALTLRGDTLQLQARGCQPAAYALLCRGQLNDIVRLQGATTARINTDKLPTGVNELLVLDASAQVLASRLFFVNRNDKLVGLKASTDKLDYKPYEACTVTVRGDSTLQGMPFALSVRDRSTSESSYDDGNIMTDCLLTSDLRGFVAHPAYYFEKDDAAHRQALDLLMMVQGWRKYKRVDHLRYAPEQTLTIEGSVHKSPSISRFEPQWMKYLKLPTLGDQISDNADATQQTAPTEASSSATLQKSNVGVSLGSDLYNVSHRKGNFTRFFLDNNNTANDSDNDALEVPEDIVYFLDNGSYPYPGNEETKVDTSADKALYVEAEVVMGKEVYGLTQRTFVGKPFVFQVPPFYGQAYLRMTAYTPADSLKHNLESTENKGAHDEDKFADYYVKRDLFYPVFSHPYDYYQTHQPPLQNVQETAKGDASVLSGDHVLGNVSVQGRRRRASRAIDYSKPAYVVDAMQLYNEATDRGLSWGITNMELFPPIACATVYANMGRANDFRIEARVDRYPFFRNYTARATSFNYKTPTLLWEELHLKHISTFRFYTDFEPRNYETNELGRENTADITLDYDIYNDQSSRPTLRDRFAVIDGFAEPLDFYTPDYSRAQPTQPSDYRRTLYWNPNAALNGHGTFQATFFNNSKETRMETTANGLTRQGTFMVGSSE